MNETAQMNRYRRACEAAVSRLAGPHSSAGHRVAAEHDHRLLLEHSPTAGSQPVCEGCGGSWPCDLVEAAMQQVGVRS